MIDSVTNNLKSLCFIEQNLFLLQVKLVYVRVSMMLIIFRRILLERHAPEILTLKYL